MATGLAAGVARVTITPPVGIPMMGFAGRGSSDGLHDDLTATALVLEGPAAGRGEGGARTRVAIVACDLLFLRYEEIQSIRAAVEELTDVPGDNVLVCCSHTHYGPLTDPVRAEAPQVEPYLATLPHLLAGAVAMACAGLKPCVLGFGQGEVRVGINRRERLASGEIILGQNPAGPVDPRVAVLRIDTADGQPLAAVLNYACHPVSLSWRCTHLSADFPGTARRLVEEQTGATCLFLQGATGDVNPLLMGWDWTHLPRLGLPLGAEAARVYHGTPTDEAAGEGGLAMARATVNLPPLLPASVEDGQERVAALEAECERLRQAGDAGAAWWAEQRLERAQHGLAVLQGRAEAEPVVADLAALRVGREVGLATAPGEIFTEIGRSILAGSPFVHTLYAAYTDGTIGYVPTRAAYPEGGYEVTHACRVAPEAGEMVAEVSGRLLRQVRPEVDT